MWPMLKLKVSIAHSSMNVKKSSFLREWIKKPLKNTAIVGNYKEGINFLIKTKEPNKKKNSQN